MNLSPYKFNAIEINDGSNYTAKFILQPPLPDARLLFVDKGVDQASGYTGKSVQPQTWEMVITMLGTINTQYEALKALFDTRKNAAMTLIAKDTADSSRQWSISAAVEKFSEPKGRNIFITFGLDDVWKCGTETETTWSITATGQYADFVIDHGNLDAYPVIEITPTTTKTGVTQQYKRFITIYNQKLWSFAKYRTQLFDNGTGTGVLDTAALISDNSNKCLLNGAINDSVTTITYDNVTGALPSSGMLYVDTEQISYTGKSATQFTGCVRGVGGTAAASHLDNAVTRLSHMLANGDDLQVYVNDIEVERWVTGINTTSTKCWINLTLARKQEFLLSTAIAASGAITSVDVNADITSMPDEGMLMIDSEIMTYTSKNDNNRTFLGITRATKETAEAAHTVGDTVRWIQHSIYVYYGDAEALAKTEAAANKPMINLSTSTNITHVYADFKDDGVERSGEWNYSPNKWIYPYIYTANQGNFSDPATEMGIRGGYKTNKGDAIYSYWILSHPAGITNWNFSNGEKRNLILNHALLQVNIATSFTAASSWSTLYAIPATTVANTWQTWSDNRALGATYYHIRFAVISLRTALSVEAADCSVTLAAAGIPIVSMSAEIATGYTFKNVVLYSSTTGEGLTINQTIKLGEKIIINTLTKRVTYNLDNSSIFPAITKTNTNPVRSQWLRMIQGTNRFVWYETGVAGVDVVVKWQGRNN